MIGQTISHYKITGKLGEGGMGVVYKAEDSQLERTVALKFLAAHLLQDEEARKRFHREAKAAASLHHANVCPVYEIAEAEGRTFISMAFIEGESLDKRIEQGPLKIPEALDIAQQIARGLEAAHEKKVVHRDIKPGNVIVDGKSHVTVMDFGLALLTEGSKLTQLDTTVGTVAYMSPEQAQGVGSRPPRRHLGAGLRALRDGLRATAVQGPLRQGAALRDRSRGVRAVDGGSGRRADGAGVDRRQVFGRKTAKIATTEPKT